MDKNWFKDIQNRVEKVPIKSGRSKLLGRVDFDNLVFLPAQLSKRPIDYFKEPISSRTVIGKKSNNPIELATPLIIGAMSFGALSKEAKIALAKASTLAGTIDNTGEGGMLDEQRQAAKYLIAQYSTGRFGLSKEYFKQADAIEIKIGQGAKPGQGGLLPKDKLTEEIVRLRKVPKDQDVHSPAYHADINNINDLRQKIIKIRAYISGKPIIIKLGAGHVQEDIRLAVQANPDIIALDGLEGGTGAAPEIMLDHMGLPTLAALGIARQTLDQLGARQELWIAGGLNKGADFAKALTLGADAVFMGFPLLVALGCIYCQLCWQGKCPKGITTQEPELRKKLDINQAAHNVAQFIKNSTEEIKMIAGATGKDNIHDLDKNDLRAIDLETSQITHVKFIAE